MNWKKQQQSLQPLRYGPQYKHRPQPAVLKSHLNIYNWFVVMGVAGACCSVSNGLIPLMGPKVPG